MSIDRCSRCGDLVDTDNEPEAYVEIGNMRRLHETICLCSGCRDRREAELDDTPRRMPQGWQPSPAQQVIIDAHEAADNEGDGP